MSIASEITRINTNIANAYTQCNNKGATMPSTQNSANLADTISTITTGGGGKPEQTKTATPTTSQQTILPDTGYTLSSVTVNAMPSGALSTPTINTSTGVVTASVGTSGYLASGTNSTLQLTTQSAQTITPTTSNQTIASGKYLTGTQTISGDANLVAGNIKKNTTIFGVTGSYEGGGTSTIDVAAEKLKFAYSTFTTIPSYLDFSNVTDFGYMFMANSNLQTVRQIDTSKGTTFTHMFSNCFNSNLSSLPVFNTSKGTNFESIFASCMYLTSTPEIDTAKGTNTASMFSGCNRLVTIPEYDFSSTTFIGNSFMTSASALTTVGGFKNLGKAFLTSSAANYYAYVVNLSPATSLTHNSLMNVINKLYDIATKGCKTQKLLLGSTNIAKLTSAEIAIATNKGWTVT